MLPSLVDAREACDRAFIQWHGKLDKKGMARINRILDRFHGNIQRLEMIEFTSTALALLNALQRKLIEKKADGRKLQAIDDIIEKFFVVHEFFDPGINQLIPYYHAAKLEKKWDEIIEGAE